MDTLQGVHGRTAIAICRTSTAHCVFGADLRKAASCVCCLNHFSTVLVQIGRGDPGKNNSPSSNMEAGDIDQISALPGEHLGTMVAWILWLVWKVLSGVPRLESNTAIVAPQQQTGAICMLLLLLIFVSLVVVVPALFLRVLVVVAVVVLTLNDLFESPSSASE